MSAAAQEGQADVLLALLEDCTALLPAWMQQLPAASAAYNDVSQVAALPAACTSTSVPAWGCQASQESEKCSCSHHHLIMPMQATQDVLAAHKLCASGRVTDAAPSFAASMRAAAAALITSLEQIRDCQ